MHVLQAQERLVHQLGRLGRRELPPPLQHLLQSLPFEVLHDEVVAPAGLSEVKGADDVEVLEPHRHACLALEASQELRVRRLRRRQQLDGHDVARNVRRLEHPRHPPLADQLQQPVVVEEQLVRLADQQLLGLIAGQIMAGHQPLDE